MVLPKLYSSWFCPFAQRALIAFEQKNAKYELVEMGYKIYNKTPEWLAISPQGMVPTIVNEEGRSICDSSVCIQYIDQRWPDPPLFPKSKVEKERLLEWGDFIESKITRQFYALLLRQNGNEQERATEELIRYLGIVTKEMDTQGPFFSGSTFGYVDILLAPFAQRIDLILPYYRDFKLPDNELFRRYKIWWRAVMGVPGYKKSCETDERLMSAYERYADGSSTSKVAEAVRKNKPLP